jgi:hypothetical protein
MGGRTHRCCNHPERLAIGKCNDCGESFCGDCLHVYNLVAEREKVTLYLCPTCLRRRYAEKANSSIGVGIILILSGVFAALVSIPFAAILCLIGAVTIVYGFVKKGEMPEETTIEDMQVEEKKRQSELASMGEGIDPEEAYNRLLSQYVNRWGAQTGTELLESEIMAYTMHGMSYTEAVKKVFQRQEKKTSQAQ